MVKRNDTLNLSDTHKFTFFVAEKREDIIWGLWFGSPLIIKIICERFTNSRGTSSTFVKEILQVTRFINSSTWSFTIR
jgi:hypothetical protein